MALVALLTSLSWAADTQQVAQTPPMGWNSWNKFACNVSEDLLKSVADTMASNGMKDKRDANGVLQTNSKFPDMKALADYVHSKGLKIGIYSSPGPKTCAGFEGSYGHEEQDAKMYAAWGIDYLKYDLCSFIPEVMQKQAPKDPAAQMKLMHTAYDKMGKALQATGRPIVYSLCQYGWDAVWEWAPSVGGNVWRTTGDIEPNMHSIYANMSLQAGLASYAGPGHWNDPDMLEVGNGELSVAENRAHFSMWAMLASPLLAGNDLSKMKPEIRDILTKREVIAIDQDKLGKQAQKVDAEGQVEVWTRPLAGGGLAVAILNIGDTRYSTHPYHLYTSKLGLHGPQTARDLWSGKPMQLTDGMPLEIASHDILLLRIDAPK
jgi:alpha-galactosidase